MNPTIRVFCTHYNEYGNCLVEDYEAAESGKNPSRMVQVVFDEFTQSVPLSIISKVVDIKSAVEQGYATHGELQRVGYQKKFDLGENSWGFRTYVIIDNDNNQWDFIPEDMIYQLRDTPESMYLNAL